MSELQSKNLRTPEETIDLPGVIEDIVDLGDLSVSRSVLEPGWRWSTHIRPQVGGDWCQARHVGVVLSGRIGIQMEDGTVREFGPDDVYIIPPGHDGYVIGHEQCVAIEWSGVRAFAGFRALQGRALATLLFTDLANSTALTNQLGDNAWRNLLSAHFEGARVELDRFGGREVNTTGDGMLATFEGPAQALRCAGAIRDAARDAGLAVRAAVHVGEVELVGKDVRGSTVNAAARIVGIAGAHEILLSEMTRILAQDAGFEFEDRGEHKLKGLPETWRLYAHVPKAAPTTR